MSGALSKDEDEWYDTDKWEKFKESGARVSGARTADGEDRRRADNEQQRAERVANEGVDVEWMRVGGCDVCLPKDRRKPLNGSRRFNAVVHFVGGVFVGTVPKQAYRPFIEVHHVNFCYLLFACACACACVRACVQRVRASARVQWEGACGGPRHRHRNEYGQSQRQISGNLCLNTEKRTTTSCRRGRVGGRLGVL